MALGNVVVHATQNRVVYHCCGFVVHLAAAHVLPLSHCWVGVLEHVRGYPRGQLRIVEGQRDQLPEGIRAQIGRQTQRFSDALPLVIDVDRWAR